jgi:2-hydroxychromene-2-carboxylate isomerase
MAEPLVFRFDFASPYSYLAAERIDALAARFGREVAWRPVLLGAIFKHFGTVPLTRQPGMHDYAVQDFARSARFLGLPFNMPMRFPIATQVPARAYYWLLSQDEAVAKRFARAAFNAYFVDGRDISEPATVLNIAAGLDVDPVALSSAIENQAIKDRLRAETDGAIALGVFGAPWIMVDGEPFWGADRLPQIERWLETGGF